ncbi:MAG: hypothetical protein KGD65_05255 [Candidatus Lokiarchaeota archaeon]|nr:hypothetical protein [Candidatus Lokiarchaeota archaeon]
MSDGLLLKIFEKVKQKQLIDEDFINFLELVFPDKSSDVLETLKRGITKYTYKPSNRVVWVAMGKNQEHLIYPKLFCSCQDYYKSVVINRNRNFCKHIIAQIISEALHNFKETTLEDNRFKELVRELKLQI